MTATMDANGMLLFSNAKQTLFEIAMSNVVKNIIRRNSEYRASHINEICTKSDFPHLLDNYSSRVQGYYSIERAYELVNGSTTPTAQSIKAYIAKLYADGDYVLIDTPIVKITVDPPASDKHSVNSNCVIC